MQKDKIVEAWEHIQNDEIFEKVPPRVGEKMILNITKAKYIQEFTVKIWFNDGLEKIVDLRNYIHTKNILFFSH